MPPSPISEKQQLSLFSEENDRRSSNKNDIIRDIPFLYHFRVTEEEAYDAFNLVKDELRLVEVRPRSPLKGLFDGLSDLVPEGKHIRDLGFLERILADKLDNIGKQLRIWSGTFAFDRDCATNFIRQGHDDGLAALRHLRPKEKLNW